MQILLYFRTGCKMRLSHTNYTFSYALRSKERLRVEVVSTARRGECKCGINVYQN